MIIYNGHKMAVRIKGDGLNTGTGSDIQLETKLITNNGVYKADDGHAYSEVTVDVQPTLQEKTVEPATSTQIVEASAGYDGLNKVTVNKVKLYHPICAPTTNYQSIKPQEGYMGFSGVSIEPILLEELTVKSASTTQTVSPSNHGFSKVTVEPFVLQKNIKVDPSTSAQLIQPESGYDGLGDVLVRAVSLQNKIVTQNGTVTADDGYNGLGTVTVEVTANGTQFKEMVECNITEVTADDLAGVTSVGDYAFYKRASLTDIAMPESVTTIGNNAFEGCSSLANVTVGDGVTTIEDKAFYNCAALTNVTIGEKVTNIGADAFYGCSGLTKTNYTGTAQQWANITFADAEANPINFAENLYINDSLLTSVSIMNSASQVNVSSYAFYKCETLKTVTFGKNFKKVGTRAFFNCKGLTSVAFPLTTMISNNVEIGDYAFSGCSGLTTITIPATVTKYGTYAFQGCTGLTKVTINSTVSIAAYTFRNCSNVLLYDFRGCKGVPSLSNTNAFQNMPSDCKIVVPDAYYDTWKADTNWSYSTIVSHIVKASEYTG